MMRAAWEAVARALAVVRRCRLDREFDEELATHLELLTEQHERRGLPRLERFLETIHAVGKDLRHAARSLARARAFALVCILSLGVGMGAFVALVTFMRALTTPARAIDTNGLVELLVTPLGPLRAKTGVTAIEEWSYPDFQQLRQADTAMEVTAWAMGSTDIGLPVPESLDPEVNDRSPARVRTLFVSANYFRTLGVSLARGPGFDPAVDDRPSASPRVALSHGFWRGRLGSDPDIVGKTVPLDGVPHEVIGIAPPDFTGHFNAFDESNSSRVLFMALERHPRLRADRGLRFNRNVDWLHLLGRLAPGVGIAQASAMVSSTMAGLSKEFPATNEFKAATVEPYFAHGAARRREMQHIIGTILGLAGMVLLIVCVNISGMMLVRGAARERELSIREAIGADRRRLMQYLFFEAVWLALVGGGLSIVVLFGIPAGIARWFGRTVPPEFDLDAAGIAICGGLCLAVSVVLGLLPALRLSRPNLIPALKDDAIGGGHKVSRVHRWAAAIQVAIAVPFLVISGVMLDRVRTADFGFVPEGLVAARVEQAASKSGRPAVSIQNLRDALAGTGGVLSVTLGDGMPIDFDEREVRVSQSPATEFASAHVTHVAERYLETIGARLLRGRSITKEDRAAGARVVVISEPLATKLFPRGDAIGERLTFSLEEGREEAYTIIGVTADFATSQLTAERPQMLLPLAEKPSSPVCLIARGAAADETRLRSAIQNVGRDFGLDLLSSRLGVFQGIVTGTQLKDKSLHDVVAESISVAVAGGIVLLLASLGVLGVIAFMVATRTREIAVRMALGATRPRVLGLMLVDVVKLVTPGVVVGLVVGAVLIRTMDRVMGTPLTVGPKPLGAVEPLVYVAAASWRRLWRCWLGYRLPAARHRCSP